MITSRFSPLPKQALWLSENWKLPDRLGEEYSFLELESDEGVPQESSESELFSGLDAVFEVLKAKTGRRFVVWMEGPFLNDEFAPALARICAITNASPFYIAAVDNTSGGAGYRETWMSVLVTPEDLRRLASDPLSGDSVTFLLVRHLMTQMTLSR